MKSANLRTISEASHESSSTADDKSTWSASQDKPQYSQRTQLAMLELEKLKRENEERFSKQRPTTISSPAQALAIHGSRIHQKDDGPHEQSESKLSEAGGIRSSTYEGLQEVTLSRDFRKSVSLRTNLAIKEKEPSISGYKGVESSKNSYLSSLSKPNPALDEKGKMRVPNQQLDPCQGSVVYSTVAPQGVEKPRAVSDKLLNIPVFITSSVRPKPTPHTNCKQAECSKPNVVSAEDLKYSGKQVQSNATCNLRNSSMSSRTKVALEEIDNLKREYERLKKDNSRYKEKMRYLEQERVISTKARVDEIQKLIQQAQELDVAFLVDATYSMQPSIDMVKHEIAAMAAGISRSYPQCKLRFALAIYRDYSDPVHDASGCDFTASYDAPESEFSRALSCIECKGGGDLPEDVFTGLETAAGLDWQATNRLLVHIGDAPCHGSQFHSLRRGQDDYHEGDKLGRDIQKILQELRETCKITLYCFCHITDNTVKMMREFRKAAGDDDSWVEEWRLSDISKVPEKVVAVSRLTIAKTLSVLQKGRTADGKYVKEVVVERVPSWTCIKAQEAVEYIHTKFPSLRHLLDTIRRTCPLELTKVRDVLVQIALHPFSGEGAVRWPYYALVNGRDPSQPAREVVIKRFKIPFGKSPRQVHSRECYVSQMEVQTVAAHMAKEFNKCTARLPGVMKIEFTEVSLLEVGDKFYTMEKLLRGEWIRYSNNGEYVNMTDYAATLQAFSHWTYHVSKGLLMVTDLQGVKQPDAKVPGQHVFCLCDPAIHTNDENVMRFTGTNLGEGGFSLFLNSHKCNDVCRHLGLPAGIAGHTDIGTKISWR